MNHSAALARLAQPRCRAAPYSKTLAASQFQASAGIGGAVALTAVGWGRGGARARNPLAETTQRPGIDVANGGGGHADSAVIPRDRRHVDASKRSPRPAGPPT